MHTYACACVRDTPMEALVKVWHLYIVSMSLVSTKGLVNNSVDDNFRQQWNVDCQFVVNWLYLTPSLRTQLRTKVLDRVQLSYRLSNQASRTAHVHLFYLIYWGFMCTDTFTVIGRDSSVFTDGGRPHTYEYRNIHKNRKNQRRNSCTTFVTIL